MSSTSWRIDRRAFFVRVGVAIAGLPMLACDAPMVWPQLSMPDLLASFGAEKVDALGRAYLAARPAEHDVRVLTAAITSRMGTASTRTATLAEIVSDDFSQGRVIFVDGWLLSITEARQCALHALTGAPTS